jgi:hypothetical protein
VELGRLKEAFRQGPLREYGLLTLSFLVGRALVHLAGLRFNFELAWMVLSDPRDLVDHLLETLFYSHSYPPGFNLLTGIVLKLGGAKALDVAHVLFEVFGLLLAWSFFYLGRASGLSFVAALVVSVAFGLVPQSIYFEHLYLYTYPTALLLVVSVCLFHRAVERQSFWTWFVFFATCSALGWLRSTFHLVWFFAMLAFALKFSDHGGRRRVLTASALPAVFLLALYVKNSIVFGTFGAGTFGVANLTTATVRRMPAEEREAWIRDGKLSPYAEVDVFQGPREYVQFFQATENARWPPMMNLVDRPTVWAPNYNHWFFLEVNPKRRDDAITYLKVHPREYVSTVFESLKRFFQPSTEWHPLDKTNKTPHLQHRQVLGGYERFYNAVVHGLPEPVGLYALLPFAYAWGVARARSLLRARTAETTAQGALLLSCLFQIAFVVASCILFTFGDMPRYRYEIESLIWLVMTLAIADVVALYVKRKRDSASSLPTHGGVTNVKKVRASLRGEVEVLLGSKR